MSDYAKNYIYDLEKKYLKEINKEKKEKVISAIKIIESSNRSLSWRIIEYVVVIYELLSFKWKRSLTNYSIGIYQAKITMILDYMKIDYDLIDKKILVNGTFKLKSKAELFTNRNSYEMVKNSIIERFPDYNLDQLSEKELCDIALFYSRNIEFIGELNYYTVLRHLYNTKNPSANTFFT